MEIDPHETEWFSPDGAVQTADILTAWALAHPMVAHQRIACDLADQLTRSNQFTTDLDGMNVWCRAERWAEKVKFPDTRICGGQG